MEPYDSAAPPPPPPPVDGPPPEPAGGQKVKKLLGPLGVAGLLALKFFAKLKFILLKPEVDSTQQVR